MESAQVEAVESRLRDLAARYATAVDQRDTELLLSAFEPDATLVVVPSSHAAIRAGQMSGHAELTRIMRLVGHFPRTFHLLGQSTYSLAGDGTASGVVYCLAHHLDVEDGAGSDLVMFIRYHDVYAPQAGGDWKIRRREVLVDWTETRATNGG
jgi:ketosteroid isomerase-like protein